MKTQNNSPVSLAQLRSSTHLYLLSVSLFSTLFLRIPRLSIVIFDLLSMYTYEINQYIKRFMKKCLRGLRPRVSLIYTPKNSLCKPSLKHPPPPLQEQILAQCATFTWEYTSTPNTQQFVEINDSGCGVYWVLRHTMTHLIRTHDTHTWHSYMTFTNDQTHTPSGVQLLSCGDFPIHDLKQSVQGPEWICITQFRRRNFDPHHGRRFGRGGWYFGVGLPALTV